MQPGRDLAQQHTDFLGWQRFLNGFRYFAVNRCQPRGKQQEIKEELKKKKIKFLLIILNVTRRYNILNDIIRKQIGNGHKMLLLTTTTIRL